MLSQEKEALKSSFMSYIDSHELCKDNQNILEILPDLLTLQNEKGTIYGRSWCKHGDISAFFQIERKFDRIHNIMERAMKEGTEILHSEKYATPTETFLDTVVDLGLYALMWVGFIRENHPEEYEKFLKSNQLNKVI